MSTNPPSQPPHTTQIPDSPHPELATQHQTSPEYDFTPLPSNFRTLMGAPIIPHQTLSQRPHDPPSPPTDPMQLPSQFPPPSLSSPTQPTPNGSQMTLRSRTTRDLHNALTSGLEELNAAYTRFMSQFSPPPPLQSVNSQRVPDDDPQAVHTTANPRAQPQIDQNPSQSSQSQISLQPPQQLPSTSRTSPLTQFSTSPLSTSHNTPIPPHFPSTQFNSLIPPTPIPLPTIYVHDHQLGVFPSLLNDDSVLLAPNSEYSALHSKYLQFKAAQNNYQSQPTQHDGTDEVTQNLYQADPAHTNSPESINSPSNLPLNTPAIQSSSTPQPLFVPFNAHRESLQFNEQPQIPGWHAYVANLYATKQVPVLHNGFVDEWVMWDNYLELIKESKESAGAENLQFSRKGDGLADRTGKEPSNNVQATRSEELLDLAESASTDQQPFETATNQRQSLIDPSIVTVDMEAQYSDAELRQIHDNFVKVFKTRPEFHQPQPVWVGLGLVDELLQQQLFSRREDDSERLASQFVHQPQQQSLVLQIGAKQQDQQQEEQDIGGTSSPQQPPFSGPTTPYPNLNIPATFSNFTDDMTESGTEEAMDIVRAQEIARLRQDLALFGSGLDSAMNQQNQADSSNFNNTHNNNNETPLPSILGFDDAHTPSSIDKNAPNNHIHGLGDPVYADRDFLADCLASAQQLDRALLSRPKRRQNSENATPKAEVYSINKLSLVPSQTESVNAHGAQNASTLNTNNAQTPATINTNNSENSTKNQNTNSDQNNQTLSHPQITSPNAPKHHPAHQKLLISTNLHKSLQSTIGDNYYYVSTTLFEKPEVHLKPTPTPHQIPLSVLMTQYNILLSPQALTLNNENLSDVKMIARFNVLNTMFNLLSNAQKTPKVTPSSSLSPQFASTHSEINETTAQSQFPQQHLQQHPQQPLQAYSRAQLQDLVQEIIHFTKTKLFFFPHQALSLTPSQHFLTLPQLAQALNQPASWNNDANRAQPLLTDSFRLFNAFLAKIPPFHSLQPLHPNDTIKYLNLLQAFSATQFTQLLDSTPTSSRCSLESAPTLSRTPQTPPGFQKEVDLWVKRRYLFQFLQQFNQSPELNDLYFLSSQPFIHPSQSLLATSAGQSQANFTTDLIYTNAIRINDTAFQTPTHQLQQRFHTLLQQIPPQFHSTISELIFSLQPDIKPPQQLGPNGQPLILPQRPQKVTVISKSIQILYDLAFQAYVKAQFAVTSTKTSNSISSTSDRPTTSILADNQPNVPSNSAAGDEKDASVDNQPNSKVHRHNNNNNNNNLPSSSSRMTFRTLTGQQVSVQDKLTGGFNSPTNNNNNNNNDDDDDSTNDLDAIYAKIRANVDRTAFMSANHQNDPNNDFFHSDRDISSLFPSLTDSPADLDIFAISPCTCGRLTAFQHWYDKIEGIFSKHREAKHQPHQPGLDILYMLSTVPAAMQLITEYLQCPCVVEAFRSQFVTDALFDVATIATASTTNTYTRTTVSLAQIHNNDLNSKNISTDPHNPSLQQSQQLSLQQPQQQQQQQQQQQLQFSNLFSHPLRPALPLRFFNSIYSFPVTASEAKSITENRIKYFNEAQVKYQEQTQHSKSPLNLSAPRKSDYLEENEEFSRVILNNAYFFNAAQPISSLTATTSISQDLVNRFPISAQPTSNTGDKTVAPPQLHLLPLTQISKVPIFSQPTTPTTPSINWDALQDVQLIIPSQTLPANATSSILTEFIDPVLLPLFPSLPSQISPYHSSPQFCPDKFTELPQSHFQTHAKLSAIEPFTPLQNQFQQSISHVQPVSEITTEPRATATATQTQSQSQSQSLHINNITPTKVTHITYQGGFYVQWTPNNRVPVELLQETMFQPQHLATTSVPLLHTLPSSSQNSPQSLQLLGPDAKPLDPSLNFLTTHEKNTFLYQLCNFYNILPPSIPLGTCSNVTIYTPLDAQHPIVARLQHEEKLALLAQEKEKAAFDVVESERDKTNRDAQIAAQNTAEPNLVDSSVDLEELSSKPIERDYDISLTYGTLTLPSLLSGLNKLLPLIVPQVDLQALLIPLLNEPKPSAIKQQQLPTFDKDVSQVPGETAEDLKTRSDYIKTIASASSSFTTPQLSPLHLKINQIFQSDPFFKHDIIDSCLLEEGVHFTQDPRYFDVWSSNDIPFHDEAHFQPYLHAQQQFQYDYHLWSLHRSRSMGAAANHNNLEDIDAFDAIDADVEIDAPYPPFRSFTTPHALPEPPQPPIPPEPEYLIKSPLPFSPYELALLRNAHKHHPYYKSSLHTFSATIALLKEKRNKKLIEEQQTQAQKSLQQAPNASTFDKSPTTAFSNDHTMDPTGPGVEAESGVEVDFFELTTLQNIIPALLHTLRSILISPITTTSYSLLPIAQRLELFQLFTAPVLNESAPQSYSTLQTPFSTPQDDLQSSRPRPPPSGLVETTRFGSDFTLPPKFQDLFTTLCTQFNAALPPFHNRYLSLSADNKEYFKQTLLSPVLASPLVQLYVLFGHNIGQYAYSMFDALLNPVFTRYMLGQRHLTGPIRHQVHSLVNVQGLFNELKRSTLQSIQVRSLDYRHQHSSEGALQRGSSDAGQAEHPPSRFLPYSTANSTSGLPNITSIKLMPQPVHQLLFPHLPDAFDAMLTTHNSNVISTLKRLQRAKTGPNRQNNQIGKNCDEFQHLEEQTQLHNPLHFFTVVNPNLTQFIYANPFYNAIAQQYAPADIHTGDEDNQQNNLLNEIEVNLLDELDSIRQSTDLHKLPNTIDNKNIFNRFSQVYTDNQVSKKNRPKRDTNRCTAPKQKFRQLITSQQLILPTISPSISALDESLLASHLYNKYLPTLSTIMEQLRSEQIEAGLDLTTSSTAKGQFTNNISRLDYISLASQYHTEEFMPLPHPMLENADFQRQPIRPLSLKFVTVRLSLISDAHQQLYTLVNEAIQLVLRCLLVLKRIQTNGKGIPELGYQMLLNWFNTSCFVSMQKITKQLHYAMLQLILSHCMLLSFDCVVENISSVFGLPPRELKPEKKLYSEKGVKQLQSSPSSSSSPSSQPQSGGLAGAVDFGDLSDSDDDDCDGNLGLQHTTTDLRRTNQENDNFTQLFRQTGKNADQYYNPIFNPYWANMQQLMQLAMIASTGVRKSLVFDDRKL